MTDHFAALPPELTKQIFSYLLLEHAPIKLMVTRQKEVALRGHKRDKHHRGQRFDSDPRQWVPAPPSITAPLFVNKQWYAVASQVLCK